ncbi:MAG TPA: nicotinamidase [Desulfuromonadales bacterium]|nr:nicotinamidase [Desulfuromonadales bacterium]
MSATGFEKDDLLLLVDVQKDFCPGGKLAIEDGDAILPELNRWIDKAREAGVPVYASRDWHPGVHISFQDQGGAWPPHCVQDSDGARFHPELKLPFDAVVVTKGVRFDQDQNSAFDQTGLAKWLRGRGIERIFLAGLAQDVCVLATALDAREAGFEVVLLAEGTRPVSAADGRTALEKMREAGVRFWPAV